MRPVLVLGLGNRLMMDDGVGVAVVEALARQQPLEEGLWYEVGETDFNYCLDLVVEAERLILVDAAVTGQEPGAVMAFPLEEAGGRRPGLSLHHLHLLDLLRLSGPPKPAVLIGIEPYRVDFGWGLSEVIAARFSAILSEVRRLIGAMSGAQPGLNSPPWIRP